MRHLFRCTTITVGFLATALAASGPVTAAPPAPVSPAPAASFSIGGSLDGVAATSASDAWAVGATDAGGTLIVHWNGSSWQQVPSPSTGPHGSYTNLSGVAATAVDNAWAVGSSTWFSGDRTVGRAVILHWNGATWKLVPSPNLGAYPSLSGVAATSANNVWAVGSDREGTVILHWNGRAWRHVPSPSPSGTLESVAATSARSAWAVGFAGTGGGTGVGPSNTPLILHWNGIMWKRAATNLAPGLGNLRSVAATSSGQCMGGGLHGLLC